MILENSEHDVDFELITDLVAFNLMTNEIYDVYKSTTLVNWFNAVGRLLVALDKNGKVICQRHSMFGGGDNSNVIFYGSDQIELFSRLIYHLNKKNLNQN